MDLLEVNSAAEETLKLLKSLSHLSQKTPFLVEEIEKLILSLNLAKDSVFEQKLVPRINPLLEILRETEDKINEKLSEIEGIVISARTNIVKELVTVSEISGKSLEGDRDIERNEIEKLATEVALDIEVEKWQQSSSCISSTLMSSKNKTTQPGTWPVSFLPLRNNSFFPREIAMSELVTAMFSKDLPDPSHVLSSEHRKVHHVCVFGSESGLGKSELVKEFAHQLLDGTIATKYANSHALSSASLPQCVIWISCDDEGAIIASYREVANLIETIDSNWAKTRTSLQYSKSELVHRVNQWLKNLTVPWLLVLDNLNNSDLLETPIIPISRHVVCSSANVIITSRYKAIQAQWEETMSKNLKNLEPAPEPYSLSSRREEEEPIQWNRHLDIVTVSHLTQPEVWSLCHSILGQDMDHGLDDHLPSASGGPSTPEKYNPKVLQSLLHELAEMLRYSPMGLCQIFQICVDIYRYRRNLKRHSGKLMSSETIPITYISRIKELINWMSEFHRFTERELSQTPTLASSYKLFLTLQNVCFEKCGGRILALSRTLEFLAFLSPAMIDFGLIFYWLRPPSTPLLASVQRKWRLPVMSHGDHTARLPFQEAEFEISVECVFPALSPQGVRFSWRVYRTYDKFREAHDLLKSSYSNDMTNYPFPSPNLPFGAPDDVLEEAVSQRRAELSAYISALTNSSNWGRLCLSQAMVNLLGVSDQNHGVLFPKSWIGCEGNGYSSPVTCHESVDFNDQIFIEENSKTIKEDAFFKLIDPLVSVGHLTISKCHLVTKNSSNIEFLNNNSHSSGSPIDSSSNNNRTSSSYFRIYGSVNASLQESVRTWLHSNGRYESILNEVIQFIFIAFKSSHSKFKKDFSVKKSENLIGRISCEQLLPHILSLVTLASPSRATTEYFDLCTLAYHYTSNEGLYHDAVFFATRCIEVITDRPPPVGPGCEQDGLWHGYLADMFFKLSRNEEARTLYEHSLSILRRTCGQYHRHTLSCLERLGRLLYDMGKYKHSVRVLEEALQTSRQIYGRQSDANSQQSSSSSSANSLTATTHSLLKYAFGTASSSSAASPSPISANSVHIAERINQLVRVMIIDAPDTSVISKCLELKLEELAISRKIRGEYSIAVGRCLNSIGELERKLGRNANALAYFEDSFDILSKSIREETSPEFISPLYNIGIEKHHLKLLAEAKGFYLRALHLKEIEMSHGGEEEGGDDGGNANGNGNGSIGQRQSQLRGVGVDAQLGNIHDSLGMVYNDLRVYEDSIRHLQAANEIYLQLYGKENHEVAMTYTNLGYVWRCMGNLEVAKSLYTRALTTLKKVGTRSDEDIIARTRNALGELHMDSGNYAEARVLFMESLTMRVSLYGEKHRDTLAVMRNLTVLACKQGQWDEANDICTSVLTLQISLDGYKSVEVAELTGQLAEIMRHLNKIDESKKLFGKAISILKSIYGTNNHPSIAFQMSNLASTLFYCATANNSNASTSNANSSTNSSVLSECEVLYEESRKIYTAAYGNEHVTVAKCYQNLGELSRKKGNIDKALHFHQLCLEIRLRLLGADDPLVASSLYLIADILREKGEVPEAIEIANQSLTTRMKAYGLEHKEVVEGLQLLGQLMERNKQHEEAIRYFRDALRAQSAIDTATMVNQLKIAPQKETIEGSLVTANLIESLVNLMNDSPQSLDEKATLLERCLAIRKHSLGEEHADVAKTLSMLGEICSAKQNYQEAIEFHRIARVIRSKCHGEGHYLSVQSMSAIARNLKQMGRLDEARSIYEQCVINIRNQYDDSSVHLIAPLIDLVDILQLLEQYDALLLSVGEKVYRLVLRVYGENDLQTANCKLRLGDIHRSLGSPEAAKGWYIQALSLFRKLGHLFTEPTILTMEGLVWSLQELGLQEESNALNIELLEIYHRVYGDTHHRVVEELNSFGKMLRSRGNYKEANQYFNRALRIGLSLHGEDHESIIESLDGLAWILDAKGMSSDAKPLRQRIKEIQSRLQASASTSLPITSVPGAAASASAPGQTAAALLSNLSLLLSEKSE